MTTLDILTSYWHINLPALIIALLFTLWHWYGNGYKFTHNSRIFFAGILLLLLVTLSPLDFLGHHYLFSAHMTEHIMLLLIIPPLLLAGTDPGYLKRLISKSFFRKTGKVLFHPVTAWVLGVGSMYIWHIPSLYLAMKQSQAIMVLQMVSLLLIGLVFIWPVFSPVEWMKLHPLERALYLFSACVGCTVLGIFIAFTPVDVYTTLHMAQNAAVESLIVNNWGITPAIDQQMGGLIMWVPACFVYVANILITLAKWYRTPEAEFQKYNS